MISLRKDKKLSREKLGKLIDTSGAIIGRYERNERTPSVEIARKMALALDVSLDNLVGNTDLKLDSEIIKKIVDIQKLPEEERSHLFFVLDNVLHNIRTKVAFGDRVICLEMNLFLLF